MSLQSSFKNVAPTDFLVPQSKPKHHNILHNLLTDAIDSAKGIPFGMVQTVEHPIRVAKLVGQSYADTYGHGFGHFKHEFMAHPLQPLLDAISIPLMLAAGAGVGVKGVSAVAEIGRTAEMSDILAESSRAAKLGDFAKADELRAQAMQHPKLDQLAQHFRKGTSATTRMVDVPDMPGVSLPKAYSSNLFRRALTKGSESILEGTLGKAGVRNFTKEGLGERLLAKETHGKRPAATASSAKGQAAVLLGAKKAGLGTEDVAQGLGDRLLDSQLKNAMPVAVEHLDALTESKYLTGRDAQFQLIKAQPAQAAYVEKKTGFTVDSTGTAERTPHVAHPAKEAGVAEGAPTLEGYSHEQMMDFIKTMNERVGTTNKASEAFVKDGHVFLIRKGLTEAFQRDMEESARLAQKIYQAPLTMWKGFILGLSPRYFVNNVIGNAGMWAAATNPVEFTRGTLEAVKATRGIRAEAKMAKGMEVTVDSLMKKWMPDEWVNSRFGYLQHGALGVDQTAGVRMKGPLKRAGHAKFYAMTEKIAYRGPQRASLMGALHTDGDFQNLYAANVRKGMEKGEAYRDAADTIISDPRKQAAFEKRVTDWAGQYYHLNSLEKKLTAVVPFYTWDRHALRFGKEQVLSRPVSSIVLAQLGRLGNEQADKELGKVPDFMKGAIPVKGHEGGILGLLLGQNMRGRKKILLTSGYNPLAAAADDADAIAALFGQGPRSPSEAIGGQLNPVVSGFVSGVTGQRLFSGAKANTHGLGPVGGVYEDTFATLPHARLINQTVKQKILGEAPDSGEYTTKGSTKVKHTLYAKGMRQTISSMLGLNERDFSPESASALYNKEHHIKKGRRKKKRDAAAAASQLKSSFK